MKIPTIVSSPLKEENIFKKGNTQKNIVKRKWRCNEMMK